MRADIKWIQTNDYPNWNAFLSPDPLDDFGWFSLGIGPDDEDGADNFEVIVSTASAVSRAQGNNSRFKGLVVPSLDRETVSESLREYVSGISAPYWSDIVTELRTKMRWEYEGMYPHLER